MVFTLIESFDVDLMYHMFWQSHILQFKKKKIQAWKCLAGLVGTQHAGHVAPVQCNGCSARVVISGPIKNVAGQRKLSFATTALQTQTKYLLSYFHNIDIILFCFPVFQFLIFENFVFFFNFLCLLYVSDT